MAQEQLMLVDFDLGGFALEQTNGLALLAACPSTVDDKQLCSLQEV